MSIKNFKPPLEVTTTGVSLPNTFKRGPGSADVRLGLDPQQVVLSGSQHFGWSGKVFGSGRPSLCN
jgi:hypothetical protein